MKKAMLGCMPIALLFGLLLVMLLLLGGAEASAVGNGAYGIFIFPKDGDIVVTSVFGDRVHPISGKNEQHDGIDIAASFNESVLASAYGTVVIAQYHDSYGNYVLLAHENGYKTLYAHMSSLDVTAGDSVQQGDRIGGAGSTGTSTGVHIHFEIWLDGGRTDPLEYFDADTYTYG